MEDFSLSVLIKKSVLLNQLNEIKEVPVGATMRPGNDLMVAEEAKEEEVAMVAMVVVGGAVVDNIDCPHEAWRCVIY